MIKSAVGCYSEKLKRDNDKRAEGDETFWRVTNIVDMWDGTRVTCNGHL